MKIVYFPILFCAVFTTLLTNCQKEQFEDEEALMSVLPERIDYNFHVKPILSDRCFACHGPDAQKRKA